MRRSLVFTNILVFAALVVFMAAVFYPLQKMMVDGITVLRNSLLEYAESAVQKKITYQSMGPSIFGTLELRKITVRDLNDTQDNGTEPLLFVERLRIKYSLWNLITGRAAQSVSAVRIDKPVLSLDASVQLKQFLQNAQTNDGQREEEEKEDRRAEEGGSKEQGIALVREYIRALPEDFNIRIYKGRVKAVVDQTSVTVYSFSLNSFVRGESLVLKADWNAGLVFGSPSGEPVNVTIPGRADGVFNAGITRGDFNIFIPELVTDYFTLRKTRFLSVWTASNFTLRKIDDKLPYDVSFSIDFEEPQYFARISADRFAPADILTLNGKYAKYNEYLSTAFSGSGVIEKNGEQGMQYRLDFTGDFPGKPQTEGGFFQLNVGGNDEYVYFHNLKLSLPRGELSWAGILGLKPFAPNGTLTLNQFYFTKSGAGPVSAPVSGSLRVSGDAKHIGISSQELNMGGTVLSAINAEGSRTEQGWYIALSALGQENAEPDNEARSARLEADALLSQASDSLSVNVRLSSFRLDDVLNIGASAVELPVGNALIMNFANNVVVTANVQLQTNFKQVSYNVPLLTAEYHGLSDFGIDAKIRGSEKSFELTECTIMYDEGLSLTAKAEFANIKDISFSMRGVYKNTTYSASGRYTDRDNLSISSNFGFNANIVIADDDRITGRMTAKTMPLAPFFNDLFVNMNVTFGFAGQESWNVTILNFDVFKSQQDVPVTQLRFEGTVNQDRAQLSQLVFAGSAQQPLSGKAYFVLQRYDNYSAAESMALDLLIDMKSSDGQEYFLCEGRYHGSALDIRLDIQSFKLYRFILPETNMTLTGLFDISIEENAKFYSAFTLSSITGWIGNAPFDFASKGSLSEKTLDLSETTARAGEITLSMPYMNIDREQGTIAAACNITGSSSVIDFSAALLFNGGYAKIDSWADLDRAFNDFSGGINFDQVRLVKKENSETETKKQKTANRELPIEKQFEVNFSKKHKVITILGGPDNMIDAEIDTNGSFYANLAAPSPLSGVFSGTYGNTMIDIEASNVLINLETMGHLIPESFPVICTDGVVLADVTIKGDIANPKFYGNAQAYGTKIIVPQYVAKEIGPAPITLRLTGDDLLFDPILTPVGNGEGYITGSFHFDRWIPRNFELAIAAPEEKPLPYTLHIDPITSSGLASGTLNLTLDENNLLIEGDLLASDSIIGLSNVGAEFGFTRPSTSVNAAQEENDIVVQTNIKISAAKKVEFHWPSEDIPVLRANIGAGGTILLQSDSFNETLSLDGTIALRGGELFYFQRSFYIKSGELVFSSGEMTYMPRITATAETQDRNQDGPVKISIIIDNQPLTSFVPRIISDPALSQVEILSLLGSTFSGTSDDDQNVPQVLTAVADVLAQFYFVRRVERTVRDFFGIDMFSARTQALQNLIFQSLRTTNTTGVSSESDTAVNASSGAAGMNPRVGAYLDNSTIFAGKYIGSNMFVQAMASARYDKNKVDMGGLAIEVDIGIELTSPLFNIRWDITPSHPEALWIPDARITIQKSLRRP